ncbi:MAG: SMI1/KNR4 family protein, partial [Clostridia bacterium]|nr:SMI1/KNR4 family protein [Clostridia bacterium]
EKDFDFNSYKLPDGFVDFCNPNKVYSLGEDKLNIYPLKFTKIVEIAKELIFGCDVFCIPPYCIPFCDDESGGHVFYCLDYNLCGKDGSPRVIYVDNEFIDFGNCEDLSEYDFREKVIANSFAEFLEKIKEVEW